MARRQLLWSACFVIAAASSLSDGDIAEQGKANCPEEDDECGLLSTMPRSSHLEDSTSLRSRGEPIMGPGGNDTCPGMVMVRNYQPVSLTNAMWNTPTDKTIGKVDVDERGQIVVHSNGRTYFSSSCNAGWYSPMRYSPMPLLGRTLRYTIDFNGAGCGCNAALYLTSLNQNIEKSGCNDYYCDANSVCGIPCAEIDIMEANTKAWHSTLHVWNDPSGVGGGYGGGGAGWSGPRNWNASVYGPGASCINTDKPVQVAVSFPVDANGVLSAFTVTLSQSCSIGTKPCELSTSQDEYSFQGQNGMVELTAALGAGMTPIISFWSSDDMLWMDGKGADGEGPCKVDVPEKCGDHVKFYDFSLDAPSMSVAR